MSSSSSILPQPFYPVSLRNSVQEREESLPDAFPTVPTYRIPDAIFVPTGFITPAHLHFVRSHGAVPQCPPLPSSYETWQIQVHGRVAHPKTFTVRNLAETFQVVTLPVTMVCAGNRRKEQNVARKSLGFSWGSAGLSTALWTGVYLSDILAHVRPLKSCGARHVIFEGADQLPKGPYGTSQKLSWAEDKAKGMLIAWAMNGLPLEPDHGFPVRLIVPGQIGGRMVKWLTRIQVSDVESHHYVSQPVWKHANADPWELRG
ncbi:hypothetical protein PHLCEN_2v1231 [Hermanssonia centrifuga]|uniref:Oxidoreductase molybdopterin-binding domain-containing protein n=1 Tax=Hermanssonia centrifuga TaxID=98765 RepID=A0A2R6S3S8_9APHY|nr:hypothetical protein PHLCEN_2v1231 [Hermanssonia centrifuga]